MSKKWHTYLAAFSSEKLCVRLENGTPTWQHSVLRSSVWDWRMAHLPGSIQFWEALCETGEWHTYLAAFSSEKLCVRLENGTPTWQHSVLRSSVWDWRMAHLPGSIQFWEALWETGEWHTYLAAFSSEKLCVRLENGTPTWQHSVLRSSVWDWRMAHLPGSIQFWEALCETGEWHTYLAAFSSEKLCVRLENGTPTWQHSVLRSSVWDWRMAHLPGSIQFWEALRETGEWHTYLAAFSSEKLCVRLENGTPTWQHSVLRSSVWDWRMAHLPGSIQFWETVWETGEWHTYLAAFSSEKLCVRLENGTPTWQHSVLRSSVWDWRMAHLPGSIQFWEALCETGEWHTYLAAFSSEKLCVRLENGTPTWQHSVLRSSVWDWRMAHLPGGIQFWEALCETGEWHTYLAAFSSEKLCVRLENGTPTWQHSVLRSSVWDWRMAHLPGSIQFWETLRETGERYTYLAAFSSEKLCVRLENGIPTWQHSVLRSSVWDWRTAHLPGSIQFWEALCETGEWHTYLAAFSSEKLWVRLENGTPTWQHSVLRSSGWDWRMAHLPGSIQFWEALCETGEWRVTLHTDPWWGNVTCDLVQWNLQSTMV